ncbi:MAG: GTP cyclohydrolase, FolE2/MptA family [Candidatus Hydrothermarchaeaceae archaeon]
MSPDVQTQLPDIRLQLTRVGKKMVKIPRNEKRPIILLVNLECFVDLPSSQKGTHMSRSLEAINEILEEVVKKKVYRLEDLCEDIVTKILERHEYAKRCEVSMKSRFMLPTKSQKFVNLIARGEACRNNGVTIKKEIGAELEGAVIGEGGATETNRAVASVVVEVPEGHFVHVEDIVEILQSSMSNSADMVVKKSIDMAEEKFKSLPSDTEISITCRVDETLHPYSSFAETKTTVGKLKRAI